MAGISRTMPNSVEAGRSLSRTDWPLIAATMMLLLIGLMSQFSVSGGFREPWFKKQIIFLAIGAIPMGLFLWVHPRVWKRSSGLLYGLCLLLLALVFVIGKTTKGAERWILFPGGFQFQPSESAKILVILSLAAFYANRPAAMDKVSTFLLGLLQVSVPAFMIYSQPHLAAALVLIVIWFAVSLAGGVPWKTLGLFLLAGLAFAAASLAIPQVRSKVLRGYHEDRITGMANRGEDKQGRNYQTDRAEIAFGVGGVMGTGFNKGEQKAAGFIPEQQNDFIVTVIGEEGGLIGCALLLGAYGFFFYRVFLVMLNASEPFYRMVAAGIFTLLGLHTIINLAMVLQLIPVVGLWLPFLSYGGTALWLCLSCVGLLLAIRRRERKVLF